MRIKRAKERFRDYWTRRAIPTGSEHEWLDEAEADIAYRIAFYRWAEEAGLVQDEQFEFVEVGREHLIHISNHLGIVKSTIPPAFGYHVDLGESPPRLWPNTDPVRYLDRFIAVEEVWGLKSQLLHITGYSDRYSIVTQHDFVRGRKASDSEIREHMEELGFTEIDLAVGYSNSLSFYNERFAVFDLRPANVVRMPEGVTIPIDCFVERVSSEQFEILNSW